jgi:hypothetical protein
MSTSETRPHVPGRGVSKGGAAGYFALSFIPTMPAILSAAAGRAPEIRRTRIDLELANERRTLRASWGRSNSGP